MPPANVPLRFTERRLEDYATETTSQLKALEAARELLEGTIHNLVLVGPTGTGKTHLAAGVVLAMTERLRSEYERLVAEMGPEDPHPAPPVYPTWANVADLIVSLRLDMDRPMDDRDASLRVSSLRHHRGLVVLDDLGRERISDWTAETVYALCNARYENVLPTLVTSNLTLGELAASPYMPVLSRLTENGALIEMSGADYRLSGNRR